MSAIPWEVAALIAGALVTTIGILWKRLIDKEDHHNKQLLGLMDRYHLIVVKINQSMEIEEEDEGS